ncbi:MAG: hypothetical protein A4E42_02005 [Methanoregulaceae archaeon PtaU1.Bin222]|nr:MAG: hypothetical protein A4E42_02005 [Methanoregulaceae archaeon PtaU1.Bin222]
MLIILRAMRRIISRTLRVAMVFQVYFLYLDVIEILQYILNFSGVASILFIPGSLHTMVITVQLWLSSREMGFYRAGIGLCG